MVELEFHRIFQKKNQHTLVGGSFLNGGPRVVGNTGESDGKPLQQENDHNHCHNIYPRAMLQKVPDQAAEQVHTGLTDKAVMLHVPPFMQ